MKKLVVLATWVAVYSGCGVMNEADVEACEHIVEAGTALTTSAEVGTAPALSDDHKRNELALVDVSGGKGGFAKFTAEEEGDFYFFLDKDVAVKLTDANGAEVSFEKTEKSISACVDVKGKYTAELMPGTYVIGFGPTTETSVNVVVEHGAHAE